MRFANSHLFAFAELSHDRNPLHLEAAYAQATPFAAVLVHGVAALLRCLGEWSQGRSFQLRELNVDFRKPIFCEREYSLVVSEEDKKVSLRLQQQSETLLTARFVWDHWAPSAQTNISATLDYIPRTVSQDEPFPVSGSLSFEESYYLPATKHFSLLAQYFVLSSKQMPLHQLSLLLWSSYFTGMICPGRQALFLGANFVFSADHSSGPQLLFPSLHSHYDERFKTIRTEGQGTGVDSISLLAMLRTNGDKKP